MENQIRLLIAGDLIPVENVENLYPDELKQVLKNKDFSIVNLETPLTKSTKAITKNGKNFKRNPSTVSHITDGFFDGATLSNNHIMDYGAEGLADTLNTLDSYKIKYLGAGLDLSRAKEPLHFEKSGSKLAFLNFCESEFSIAGKDSPVANPFELMELYNQVIELKTTADKIFLIYHGGVEYYPLPTPKQRKTLRFLIDIGVDGIICHHTHVFGAYEYYKNKPIFYSLGNLYTPTNRKMPDAYYKSAILSLTIEKNKISHTLTPTKFDDKGICLMDEYERDMFYERLEKLNNILDDENKFNEHWQKLINEKKFYYSNIISRFSNRYFKLLRKLKVLPNPSYNSKRALQLLNVMRCDTHRETLIDILEKAYQAKFEK